MQRLSQNKVLFFYSGSAAANLISEISMPGILYTYIRWKGLHKATWGGKNCLEVWRGLTCLYTDVKLGLSQVKINGYSEGWGCEQVFPVAFKSLNTQRIILWSRLSFFLKMFLEIVLVQPHCWKYSSTSVDVQPGSDQQVGPKSVWRTGARLPSWPFPVL